MKRTNLICLLVFTGAFLFFTIQPVGAKILLPLAGGSSQLWTSCMLFYQSVILLSYLYAHLSVRYLSIKRQLLLHSLMTLLGGIVLFTSPLTVLDSDLGTTFSGIFSILTLSLGLPLFALGATSPLCQSWFGKSTDMASKYASSVPEKESPYSLYRLSNIGSLGGLFIFPFILEPFAGLKSILLFWKSVYGLYTLVLGLMAYPLARELSRKIPEELDSNSANQELDPNPAQPHSSDHDRASGTSERASRSQEWTMKLFRERGLWLLLSFGPSSLLLGLTAHMTNEIPSFPMLWITPLAIYLLSFVLAFKDRSDFPWNLIRALSPLIASIVVIILFVPVKVSGFSIHIACFFVLSLLCHRELYNLKPPLKRLTEFYLILTVGGALGGLFNALIGPHIFSTALEYPVTILLCLYLTTRDSLPYDKRLSFGAPLALLGGTLTAIALLPDELDVRAVVSRLLIIFFASAVTLLLRRRKIAYTLATASVVLCGYITFNLSYVRTTIRSFYGVSRVISIPGTTINMLFHGSTIHGTQDLSESMRLEPLYCFHRKSPIGDVFRGLKSGIKKLKVGIIGLGTGAMAAYGRNGDSIDFYEIDPAVIEIAQDRTMFTYLEDSKADVKIIYGDGRRALGGKPSQSYDLLVMDAFSSDAIPVHLITEEAFKTYFDKLSLKGICAINISNRHLRLESLIKAMALRTGYSVAIRNDKTVTSADEKIGLAPSKWAILARNRVDLRSLNLNFENHSWTYRSQEVLTSEKLPSSWTDDYSNILELIEW